MILLLLAAAAFQPQTETPRAFMERLYAGYRNENYSPFSHPERVFAPRLAAAIAEDSRLAKGEVGYVDADPVCQCQDTGGMHASVTRVTALGQDKAAVRVSIGFGGDKPRPATFSLVRTGAGWRIADVSSADEPSFLKGIEASNRQLRARH
jgi:hypothetical protein